jgi:hypothetical protein
LQPIGIKTPPIQLNLVERLKLVITSTKTPLNLRDFYTENFIKKTGCLGVPSSSETIIFVLWQSEALGEGLVLFGIDSELLTQLQEDFFGYLYSITCLTKCHVANEQ